MTPSPEGALVTSIRVEPQVELGKTQTRLTILHDPKVKYEIASQGESLAIAFAPEAGAAAVAETTDVPKPAVVTAVELPAAAPAAPAAPEPAALEPVAAPAAANVPVGEIARTLESVEVHGSGDSVVVTLLGDGVLSASDFVLPNPPRIVLDFNGVRTEVKRRTVAGAGPVLRARIAQFKTAPEKVTRVVLDLNGSVPYTTRRDGERLQIVIGSAVEARSTPAPSPAAPTPSRTVLASPAPASEAAVPPPEMPKPESPAEPVAAAPAESPAPAPTAAAGSPMTQVATGPSVESIPAHKRAPGVLEARRDPRPAAPKAAPAKTAPTPATAAKKKKRTSSSNRRKRFSRSRKSRPTGRSSTTPTSPRPSEGESRNTPASRSRSTSRMPTSRTCSEPFRNSPG